MSLEELLCPICSAALLSCDHEILQWSHCAGEYEDSRLAQLAERFEQAIEDRLELAWERNEAPSDPNLKKIYRQGQLYFGSQWDRESRLCEVRGEISEFVLQEFVNVYDVFEGDESSAFVLYCEEPGRVADTIEDRIRTLEIGMAKAR